MTRCALLTVSACAAAVMLPGRTTAHAQIPYPPPHVYDLSAALRLEVEPKHAEVFVDGYWAGIADDFDGLFQRLHLEPGGHEVVVYLEGHRSLRRKVYLQPHGTLRIRHTMEPLAPGEAPELRPEPAAPPEPAPSAAPARVRPPRAG